MHHSHGLAAGLTAGSPAATILATPGALAWFRFDSGATAHTWTDVIGSKVLTGINDPTLDGSGYHFAAASSQSMNGASGLLSGARYYCVYFVGASLTTGSQFLVELTVGAANGFRIQSGTQSSGISCRVLDPSANFDQWGQTAHVTTNGVWDMYGDKADATHPTNPIDLNGTPVTGGYDDTQAGSGTFANGTWTIGGRATVFADMTITDLLVCGGASAAIKVPNAATVAAFRSLRGV